MLPPKMHFYRIGYSRHDDWHSFVLAHEKRWDEAEWRQLIEDLAVEVAPKHLLEYPDRDRLDLYKGKRYSRVEFHDIYQEIAELMVERHGFTMVTYTDVFQPNDSDILSEEDCPEELEGVRRRLAEQGLTRERYPLEDMLPKRRWEELNDYTRSRMEESGYDEGSYNDMVDDSIPEGEKRKRPHPRRARPRRKPPATDG